MPSLAAHYVVGKNVGRDFLKNFDLDFSEEEFLKGSIYPDYIDKKLHFKKKFGDFLIPSIDNFLKTIDCLDSFNLGYIVHLLLDYYFLTEYLPSNGIADIKNFSLDGIYRDYTILNPLILKKYFIDVNFLKNLFCDCSIDFVCFNRDINFFYEIIEDDTKFLKFSDYSLFLDDMCDRICVDLINILKNFKGDIK